MLDRHLGSDRPWWRRSDIALCGSVAVGQPMDVHLFGGHLLSDLGPVSVVLALFAGATFWLFRRFGGSTPEREVAPDSELIWAELTACGCDECGPAEDEPTEPEPREHQPVRA